MMLLQLLLKYNSDERTTSEVCLTFYFIQRVYSSPSFTKQDDLRLGYTVLLFNYLQQSPPNC